MNEGSTERIRAEEAREAPPAGAIDARLALAFLAEAGATLAAADAYEDGLVRVAQLAVPSLADWCAIDIAADDGELSQYTSGRTGSEEEELLRELRRRYRSEKGGSEGVARVVATGRPELVSDVQREGGHMELAPAEREAYDRLSPRSYMIVALQAEEETIGAITFLSTAPGRRYSAADLLVIEQLANRIAVGVSRARARQRADEAFALLDGIFETAPIALGFWSPDLVCLRGNAYYAAVLGISTGELIGRRMRDLSPVAAEREAYYREIMATGEARHGVEISDAPPGRPHEVRHWIASYTPVRGADGTLAGVSVVAVDVTERQRLLATEREARARATFLARAGEILDSSLDYETTLHNVASIAVPDTADWCAVLLLDDGAIRQVAVAHADPERERWAWEVSERYPPAQDAAAGAPNVIRTGVPELVNDITDEMLVAGARDDEHLAMLRRLGLTASLCAPLQARGGILGALYLVSAESGRRFGAEDVELAVELGRRAGIAVENARLYTERTHIAHVLQSGLLPQSLPSIPGFEIQASYRAAGELNEVGGDFFDIFETTDGAWAAFVGDVSGKGAEAASVTALARFTLRAAVIRQGPPQEALKLLNDAMFLQRSGEQFATVALVCLNPAAPGESARLTLALGGHPPPMVMRADGSVEPVGRFGTLLGMAMNPSISDTEVELAVGDSLLLYTDGVVEAGRGSVRMGEDGLAKVLASCRNRAPREVVAAVELAAVEAYGGEPRDDIALIALRHVGA